MQENQEKVWLPLNEITENIWYTNDDDQNQRIIVSAPTEHPIVWKVSKVENSQPIGLQKITLYQGVFNPHTDYIEKDEQGKIVGMWADYYSSNTKPVDEESVLPSDTSCTITASTNALKVGGSYRLLTAVFKDENGTDVTSQYADKIVWKCFIDGAELTDNPDIIWLGQTEKNKIKIKLANNKSYLNKSIVVSCESGDVIGKLSLEITS